MLAGTFTSCTKDLDDVGLNASSIDAAKVKAQAGNGTPNNNAGGQGNQKATPTLSLTFSESPVVVGTPVTITVTVGAPAGGGSLPTQGTMNLQRAKLGENGPYTDAASATYWEDVVTTQIQKTGLSFNHTYTPDAVGTFGWRVRYTGGGSAFEGTETAADIVVVARCANTELTGQLINTVVNTDYTLYTVRYSFNACINIKGAKIQGGLTAFTEFVSATDKNGNTAEIRKTAKGNNESNSNISWQLGDIASNYSNSFTITFKNFKKNQEGEITGDWSVEGTNDAGEKVEFLAAPISVN